MVAEAFILPVRTVRPGTLFGEGQIERIATECEQEQAELVIVDGALSAIQQRNLEEQLKMESDLQIEASESHDYNEGVTAFVEKRAPKFQGK